MSSLLKTRCPQCQAAAKVSEELMGQWVRCPTCKQPFEVSAFQVVFTRSGTQEPESQAQPTITETEPNPAPGPDREGRLQTAGVLSGWDGARLGSLGRFELRELLGEGAFGRVYRAHDPSLDREVALKVPKFDDADQNKTARFVAEAKSAAKLHHPNIVSVYECGRTGEQHYIVYRFVSGQTLAERIAHHARDFRKAAEWVRQLAEALAYAHERGVVHRDIKPANIMLDENDVPQIMDFGLARRLHEDGSRTVEGAVIGTPEYMAPEQARGKLAEIGPRSDQYSLGVVLYELLTGRKPFSGPWQSVLTQVLTTEPAAPRSLLAEIPRELEAICQRAMSKEPGKRYETTAQVAQELAGWLNASEVEPVDHRKASSNDGASRTGPTKLRIAAIAASTAIVLVLLATTIWSFGVSPKSNAENESSNAENESSNAENALRGGGKHKLKKRPKAVATQPLVPKAVTTEVGTSRPATSANSASSDALRPGSIWQGNRKYPANAFKGARVSYFLHIREREGDKFAGHAFDNGSNRNRVNVEGEVRDSEITWRDLNGQNAVWKIDGTIEGDTIRFSLQRPNNSNAQQVGSGTLTLVTAGK